MACGLVQGRGRASHTATRDSTWDRREFSAHTLSIWLPDGSGYTFVFLIIPLLLISSLTTPLSEEFQDGLCAVLTPFFFFSSTLAFSSRNSDQQQLSFPVLRMEGERKPN